MLRERGRAGDGVRVRASAHVPPGRGHRCVPPRTARAPRQGPVLDVAPARPHRIRGGGCRRARRRESVRGVRNTRRARGGAADEVHLRWGGRGHLGESVRGPRHARVFRGGGRVRVRAHAKRGPVQALDRAHQSLGVLRGASARRAPRADKHVRARDAGALRAEQVPQKGVAHDTSGGAAHVLAGLCRVRLGHARGEHSRARAHRRSGRGNRERGAVRRHRRWRRR